MDTNHAERIGDALLRLQQAVTDAGSRLVTVTVKDGHVLARAMRAEYLTVSDPVRAMHSRATQPVGTLLTLHGVHVVESR